MNGGKEIGDSLGRNKTAQFSLTECLSNYLTQWKRSQNITAKYLWNKMYNSAGTWHDAWAPHEALTVSDLVGVANRTADGTRSRGRGCESREEGGDGALGKKRVPRSNKNGTRCKEWGCGKGGVWTRHRGNEQLGWLLMETQPLSNDQLHFTVSVSINRQWFKAAPSTLHTGLHLILCSSRQGHIISPILKVRKLRGR